LEYVVSFRETDAFPSALKGFVSMCGFSPESDKHKKMLASGMEVRKQGIGELNLKAVVLELDADVLRRGGIETGGVNLQCDAMFLIEKEKVRKILIYIVTAKECGCGSDLIMDRLYADFWGTAYVDAAHELLRGELRSRYIDGAKTPLSLSEAFGPGYYGMPTSELKSIFEIIDGGKIGVKCLPSCVMVPVKSCAGIYFVTEEGAAMPEKKCIDCLGNRRGCHLCHVLTN
jgi:hypothetical protein